jgi:hypothetical protein
MADRESNITALIKLVEGLVDQLKLLNLNLTVANARLRLRDSAFRSVEQSFGDMLDMVADCCKQAEIGLARAKGDQQDGLDPIAPLLELDQSARKIKAFAEQIIETVVSLKRRERVDGDY